MRDTGGTRHPTDWEHQREQLSAYLDGEMAAPERHALERHLPTCPQCRAELAELQRIRLSLASLPAPALPRSFVLPSSGATAARAISTERHGSGASGRQAWYRASQWVGGIAASIGLFLLLGGAIAGFAPQPQRSASGSSADMPYAGVAQATPTPNTARSTAPTQVAAAPGSATTVSGAQPTMTSAAAAATPSPTTAAPHLVSGDQEPPIGPLSGAGLVAGGVALIVAGRIARRRQSA